MKILAQSVADTAFAFFSLRPRKTAHGSEYLFVSSRRIKTMTDRIGDFVLPPPAAMTMRRAWMMGLYFLGAQHESARSKLDG